MRDQHDDRPADTEDELPADEGLRSDHAGTSGGEVGPAPGGGDSERVAEGPAGDEEPASGAGATAGGGYGVAAERPSSGNSGDGQTPADEGPQTQWLRSTDRD